MVKRPAVLLSMALVMIAAGIMAYRVVILGYPLFERSAFTAWRLSIQANVVGGGSEDLRFMIALPSASEGAKVLAGSVITGGLHFHIQDDGQNRYGVWSGAASPEQSFIGYNATFTVKTGEDRPAPRTQMESKGIVEGLVLADSIATSLMTWTRTWTGSTWENMRTDTGEIYPGSALLPLSVGAKAAQVSGGAVRDIRWTLRQQVVSQWSLLAERIQRSDHFLDRWSLLKLPPDSQEGFRILLLVPIGALMTSALRTVVGLPTFGIFMPVLMALAFRNTGLAYGLIIFGGIILIGYGFRFLLDRLHLLLIPRLSVVLTVIIGCFTVLAVVGNRMGMRELMAVGLLPFVILTMTVERFFVMVEERGIKKGLQTAAGSAAVAALAYQVINLQQLQRAFMVYPELLLVIIAGQVLIGRYTGYRISELFRFRTLGS